MKKRLSLCALAFACAIALVVASFQIINEGVAGVKIGATLLNFGPSHSPVVSSAGPNSHLESEYDRLALRRGALLETELWSMSGWIAAPTPGGLTAIYLDQTAQSSGVRLYC